MNATNPSHKNSLTDPCELTRRIVIDYTQLYSDLEGEKLVPTIVIPSFDIASLWDTVSAAESQP